MVEKTRSLKVYIPDTRYLGLICIIIVIATVFTIFAPQYCSVMNITDMLKQTALPVIISIGMAIVVAGGGFDLSVGHICSFSAMITTLLMVNVKLPIALCILIGIAISALIGLVNGIVVTSMGISSFITTLATQFLLVGIRYWITGGETVMRFPRQFTQIAKGQFLFMPNLVVYMIITMVILMFIIDKTTLGRDITAVGFNINASKYSGINIKTITTIMFVLSALLAGICGVLMASRNGMVTVDSGDGYLLDAMTIAVFSTVVFGRMKAVGVFLAAAIIVMITNGLNMIGVSPSYIHLIKGIILLIAIAMGRVINSKKKPGRPTKNSVTASVS